MKKGKLIIILSVLGFLLITSGGIEYIKEKNFYKELKKEFSLIQKEYNKEELSSINEKVKKLNKVYKKEFTPTIDSYSNYIKTVDLINKYSENGILLSYTTNTNIKEINNSYEKLEDEYKERVKNQIQSISNQIDTLNDMQKKIDELFDENDKTKVKENITLETINQYITELNKYPQKDFVVKNQIYLENAKNIIEERIKAAWVKLNVPYISQNKNNILNGCEAASMLMALQYKGYLKDMTLPEYVKLMPLSPNNNAEEGFTHDLYTLYPLTIPHWIAPTPLTKFGIDTSGNTNIVNGTGMSIDDLDRELDNNNPVIIYIIAKFNPPKEVVEGAPRNLHVMLLTGYNKITNEHFIVDPWTHDDGRTSWTVSKELLEEKYNFVGKKSVIVR